jgi:hypothetical protein
MDIHDILNYLLNNLFELLSLLVAIAVLVVQIVNYRRRLRMDLTYFHVLGVSKDISLFLIRLSFVNNSSTGRVVYDIVPENTTENITLDKAHYKLDLGHLDLIYQLPTEGEMTLPISESLLPPLDILPHQSLSKWFGMEMKVTPKRVTETKEIVEEKVVVETKPIENLKVIVRVRALDVDLHEIASCEKEVEPMKLNSLPTFNPPKTKESPSVYFSDFISEPNFVFLLVIILVMLLILSSLLHR